MITDFKNIYLHLRTLQGGWMKCYAHPFLTTLFQEQTILGMKMILRNQEQQRH